MSLCQCLKQDGKQCGRAPSNASIYCWQHKNCKNPVKANNISPLNNVLTSKQKSEKIQPKKLEKIPPKQKTEKIQPKKLEKIPLKQKTEKIQQKKLETIQSQQKNETIPPKQKTEKIQPKQSIEYILPKGTPPPLEIPKCYLYSTITDRAYNYSSDVLYGTDQILDKLTQCNIDTTSFIEIKKELDDKYQNLLENCKVYLQNNSKLIGESIVYWFAFIKIYLITPQLDKVQFNSYEKFVDKEIKEMEKLGNNYDQLINAMIKIIDETMKYKQSTGILYILRTLLMVKDANAVKINDDIDSYLELYSKTIKKFMNLLNMKYGEIYNKFSSKTIPNTNMDTTITIKKGSIFYKGGKKIGQKRLTNMDDYFWLGYDLPTAKLYMMPDNTSGKGHELKKLCQEIGFIGIYEMNNDIKLLDMSNINTIKQLKSEIKDLKVLKSLNDSFIISINANGQEIIERNSEEIVDLVWAKWLCGNGYDGYTANRMGIFPSETMLCHPKKHIKYLGYYDAHDLGFHYCDEPYINYDIELLHM